MYARLDVDRRQLKQRIVGAVVLVALGVIFIPMILNRDDTNSGISGTNIPPKPQALEQLAEQNPPAEPTIPPAPAETRQLVDKETPPLPTAMPTSAPSQVPTPVSTSQPSEIPSPAPTPVGEPKTPHGWVVQLASFSDRSKALALRNRARKAGYRCFVESISGRHGTLYRVRVGPVVKREQADKLQTSINRKLKLNKTLVQSYP